jgi:hypothetical protein
MNKSKQHKEAVSHLEASAHYARAVNTVHLSADQHRAGHHQHVPVGAKMAAPSLQAQPIKHIAKTQSKQHQE